MKSSQFNVVHVDKDETCSLFTTEQMEGILLYMCEQSYMMLTRIAVNVYLFNSISTPHGLFNTEI